MTKASCFLRPISSWFHNKDPRNLHFFMIDLQFFVYKHPQSYSLTIRFFLFNSDGASLFTDSLTVFILVAQLASPAHILIMRKPQFPFDVILLEYGWSFSMSLVKLSLFTYVWSCFLSNKIFLGVSKLAFAANMALCSWKINHIGLAQSLCSDPISGVKIFPVSPLYFTCNFTFFKRRITKCNSSDSRT